LICRDEHACVGLRRRKQENWNYAKGGKTKHRKVLFLERNKLNNLTGGHTIGFFNNLKASKILKPALKTQNAP
jgi:hypothetical protein